MKHIIPISGKDSLATAIIQSNYKPELAYEYIFNPTGLEIPNVNNWLDKVSTYLKKPILQIGKPLEEIIHEYNILPSQQMRFCTKYAKIYPLRDYIGKNLTTVYYGLRFDEPERKGHNGLGHIIPKYPLREHFFNIYQVWKLVEDKNLLPPFLFWQSIYDATQKKMPKKYFEFTKTLAPWDYQTLFSWRTRPFNCSICIYMRLYEFVGCYEHFPDIYSHWIEIEEEYGASNFSFNPNYSLKEIAKNAKSIKEKRVDQICKIIYKLMQSNMFEDHKDLLSITSCGLFCGK